MYCEPCCCTWAPVKPFPFTRLVKMPIAVVISDCVGTPPCGATALSVIVVPLERSRPSPTLNLLCQSPGCAKAPPMIAASMTMSSAVRTARYRQGLEATPGCRGEPPPGRDAVRVRGEEPPEPPAGVRGSDDLLFGGATYCLSFV